MCECSIWETASSRKKCSMPWLLHQRSQTCEQWWSLHGCCWAGNLKTRWYSKFWIKISHGGKKVFVPSFPLTGTMPFCPLLITDIYEMKINYNVYWKNVLRKKMSHIQVGGTYTVMFHCVCFQTEYLESEEVVHKHMIHISVSKCSRRKTTCFSPGRNWNNKW